MYSFTTCSLDFGSFFFFSFALGSASRSTDFGYSYSWGAVTSTTTAAELDQDDATVVFSVSAAVSLSALSTYSLSSLPRVVSFSLSRRLRRSLDSIEVVPIQRLQYHIRRSISLLLQVRQVRPIVPVHSYLPFAVVRVVSVRIEEATPVGTFAIVVVLFTQVERLVMKRQ